MDHGKALVKLCKLSLEGIIHFCWSKKAVEILVEKADSFDENRRKSKYCQDAEVFWESCEIQFQIGFNGRKIGVRAVLRDK